MMQMYESY